MGGNGNGWYVRGRELLGKHAIDPRGTTIGEIVDLYGEATTGHQLAMLARVKLSDSSESRIIPILDASVVEDGVQVQVTQDSLRAHPSLKSNKSVRVPWTRVKDIYRQYEVRLPEKLAKNAPKAVSVTRRRRNMIAFTGPYTENVLTGRARPKFRN